MNLIKDFIVFRAIKYVLKHSLKWHIENTYFSNYQGILFARQYLMGILSLRHQSYSEINELIQETGVELGSNLGKIELEAKYPELHRFTDKTHVYPRLANKGEGEIIAHRGTGTKGIIIS